MKKSVWLFLAGLFSFALGAGSLLHHFNGKEVKAVEAKDEVSYVTFDEKGVFKLGSYPQNVVTDITAQEIKNGGSKKGTSQREYYIYNSKMYSIIDSAVVDEEGSSGRKLSSGEEVNSYQAKNDVVFEFSDIEWQLLKKGENDTAYLISTRVLDRQIYNAYSATHVTYEKSELFQFLNEGFKWMAFTNADKAYIVDANGSVDNSVMAIPARDDVDLDKYQDANLKQASDFAILQNLSSHSAYNHGVGVPYTNVGYWLDTLSPDQDRVDVCWAKVAVSHCLMDDPKIGVRPVIHVHYKEGGSGGGSSGTPSSTTPSSNGGNATLGIGIAFAVLGAGGLIAFFVIWAKKHPSGKPPIWIVASIAGSLVVSIAGLGCLAGGMTGGGGNCLQAGYYVQTSQYSGGGIVQVGYTAWLIKSNGSASYCSHLKDNQNASDFAPDNYMTGTYTISGSKLIIEIPKHEIKNFGTVGGTYTYTIAGCNSFKNTIDTYHWVRGE